MLWDPFLIKKLLKKEVVGPVNSTRDPLTDQFPRKMLAGQRGGARDPLTDFTGNEHVKKKKRKKKKENAENANAQEISPIQTYT